MCIDYVVLSVALLSCLGAISKWRSRGPAVRMTATTHTRGRSCAPFMSLLLLFVVGNFGQSQAADSFRGKERP